MNEWKALTKFEYRFCPQIHIQVLSIGLKVFLLENIIYLLPVLHGMNCMSAPHPTPTPFARCMARKSIINEWFYTMLSFISKVSYHWFIFFIKGYVPHLHSHNCTDRWVETLLWMALKETKSVLLFIKHRLKVRPDWPHRHIQWILILIRNFWSKKCFSKKLFFR